MMCETCMTMIFIVGALNKGTDMNNLDVDMRCYDFNPSKLTRWVRSAQGHRRRR